MITVYFTEIVNATMSITYLLSVCKIKVRLFNWIAKPLFCIIVSTAIMRYILSSFEIIARTKFEALFHIVCGAIVYLLLLMITKAIDVKALKDTAARLRKE